MPNMQSAAVETAVVIVAVTVEIQIVAAADRTGIVVATSSEDAVVRMIVVAFGNAVVATTTKIADDKVW